MTVPGVLSEAAPRPYPRRVRVLVVDDSATMRRLIRLALSADQRLQVVAEAADADAAEQAIMTARPDVLTLDVEMPGMSGLEFLGRLMRQSPRPVVMVSAETQRGSAAALEALSIGAVDCIGKPAGGLGRQGFAALADLLVAAAGANLRRLAVVPPAVDAPPSRAFVWNGRHVLIGSSTGGVDALERLLGGFPVNCPPTVITQHMPAAFLAGFAARLNARIAPRLELATEGAVLRQGCVYLAPGGDHHLMLRQGANPSCTLVQAEKRNGHRPSVDMLFESAAPFGDRCIAALLTGMGRDGATGMLALRNAGARTVAQDRASAVIWGMPRIAAEIGAAQMVLPLDRIAPEILAMASRNPAR
ncbi:chemotaxis-specific protein-glutamate methyltransferase CheB [Paracoccus pacificus]|uniref:Protein-glutamate methylesterase/protein-glutamine glutaminase n=1 Tax=Paracoccus pacificus TaxID=1463598 RepID=A0ABW4R8M1_9RHOB